MEHDTMSILHSFTLTEELMTETNYNLVVIRAMTLDSRVI